MRKGWEYKRWKEVLTIINGKNQSAVVDENGEWLDQTEMYNISSDISCTAGQMARGLGLAMASKK